MKWSVVRRSATVLAALLLASSLYAAEDCSKDGTSQEQTPTCTAIDTATSPVTSATVTRKKSLMSAQVFDTLAGTNTVVIDCRSKTATPSGTAVAWYPCYTVTNADATGKFASLPYALQYRARLTVCTTCSVSVLFERDN